MSDMLCTSSNHIGLTGVGLLGSAMAQRLNQAGWKVLGFDPVPFSMNGVTSCDSLADLLLHADVVIFCLPTSVVSLSLVEEHIDSFRPGQILLDATTGKPEEMERLARRLKSAKVHYMEANVAGSSDMMLAHQASMFFGGDKDIYQSLSPLIDTLTRKPFHMGPVGAASRFKLVHNMILGLHRMVLAEGLSFAGALGIEPSKALDVLKQTPAASVVMETKGERMVRRQFDPPQARLSQHLKDVRIMLDQAKSMGCNVPMTELHRELLEKAEQLGFGDLDNSSVAGLYGMSGGKELGNE